MENAALQKQIKARRQGTFGAIPQARTPDPTKIQKANPKFEAPTTTPQAAPVNKTVAEPVDKKMASEATQTTIVKGVVLGVTDKGQLATQTVGSNPASYLELIALFEYANAKKKEILEMLTGSGDVYLARQIGNLTASVNELSQGIDTLITPDSQE